MLVIRKGRGNLISLEMRLGGNWLREGIVFIIIKHSFNCRCPDELGGGMFLYVEVPQV